MKTLSALALPLVLGVLSLGACATAAPPPPPLTVTEAQAGPVALARGQALEIVLPLNAGTGYAWRLDREAPALILNGGSSRITETDRPGGPVATIFSYQGAGRGKAELSFTLKRPWEPDRPGDRKAVFQVKVR
uniref:Proteinase inhibitor I42 chagasin domain-containing protein n=1 Tax=Caulobacter sp. (strain K31) TaxID=366602 RepID=B0SXR4_CAUSK